jgi:hypothetical protein
MITIAFFSSSINSKNRQNIRPNVDDIQKLTKAMIQKPYKPIEVESLKKEKSYNDEIDMLNAQIVGLDESKLQKGTNDEPTLYTTVVKPKATSVMHENQGPEFGISTDVGTASLLKQNQSEAIKLAQGQYAIPVSINKSPVVEDATLSGYETPSFLHKDEKQVASKKHNASKQAIKKMISNKKADKKEKKKIKSQLKMNIPSQPMSNPDLSATSVYDLNYVKNSVSAVTRMSQKNNAMKAEWKRLRDDTQVLSKRLKDQVNVLLKSKTISNKLDDIMKKYQIKMKTDEMSKIRLVDRVAAKRELKNKLFKEVEGLRTASSNYSRVAKINKDDIKNIVNKIKSKLGNSQ